MTCMPMCFQFVVFALQLRNHNEFIKFIDEELGPRSVNTLIFLRVDFNYEYESHPELRDSFIY